MEATSEAVEALKKQIAETEEKLGKLKKQLASLEVSQHGGAHPDGAPPHLTENGNAQPERFPLSGEEYRRYGRQMIVPSIGIEGLYIYF